MQRPSSCVVQGSPVLESQTSGSDPGRDPPPHTPVSRCLASTAWRPPAPDHPPSPRPSRPRPCPGGGEAGPPFISSFTQFPLRAGKGVKRWSPRLPPGRRGGSSHVQASLRRHARDPERQAHVGAETEAPAGPARRSGFLHREPAAELASPQNEPVARGGRSAAPQASWGPRAGRERPGPTATVEETQVFPAGRPQPRRAWRGSRPGGDRVGRQALHLTSALCTDLWPVYLQGKCTCDSACRASGPGRSFGTSRTASVAFTAHAVPSVGRSRRRQRLATRQDPVRRRLRKQTFPVTSLVTEKIVSQKEVSDRKIAF